MHCYWHCWSFVILSRTKFECSFQLPIWYRMFSVQVVPEVMDTLLICWILNVLKFWVAESLTLPPTALMSCNRLACVYKPPVFEKGRFGTRDEIQTACSLGPRGVGQDTAIMWRLVWTTIMELLCVLYLGEGAADCNWAEKEANGD
jgi:hypothetical protein